MYQEYIIFIVVLTLLLISAFFSGSETAFFAIRQHDINKLNSVNQSKLKNLLAKPDQFLTGILLGNNVVNIGLASIVTLWISNNFGNEYIPIGSILLTTLLLIFCEITPKTYAAYQPFCFVKNISLPILPTILRFMLPLSWLINVASTKILLRSLINSNLQRHLTMLDIRGFVADSGSILTKQHSQMLTALLDMQSILVEDVMQPLPALESLDFSLDIQQIHSILINCKHQQIIVWDQTVQNVIGVLSMRKIRHLYNKTFVHDDLLKLFSDPVFVPNNVALFVQFQKFQQDIYDIGLVVDEFGNIVGFLTLKDIIDEIVQDLDSLQEFKKKVQLRYDGTFVVNGNITIRELNRELEWKLPTNGPKTIGGLIIEALEDIPQANASIQIDNYRFETIRVDKKGIRRVKIWQI